MKHTIITINCNNAIGLKKNYGKCAMINTVVNVFLNRAALFECFWLFL